MARPKIRTAEEIRAYRTEYKRQQRIAQQSAPGHLNRSTRQLGERNALAKLTWPLVRWVRRQHAQGRTLRALAEKCGVAKSTIHAAVHRRTWKE